MAAKMVDHAVETGRNVLAKGVHKGSKLLSDGVRKGGTAVTSVMSGSAGLVLSPLLDALKRRLFHLIIYLGIIFMGTLTLLRKLWTFIWGPFRFFHESNRDAERRKLFIEPTPFGEHGFIMVKGTRYHFVENGQGPLMLFLHGFPECWYSWRFQMEEFSKYYHVVAIDMKGYGASDKPQGIQEYSLPSLADDLEEMIFEFGYDKCVLVSHDFGGALAWTFAQKYPELLSHMVVANAPHPSLFLRRALRKPSQMMKSSYMLTFQIPVLNKLLFSANDYQLARQMFEYCFNPAHNSQADIDLMVAAMTVPGALESGFKYYQAAYQSAEKILFDAPAKEEKVRVPTLVIHGDDDMALEPHINAGLSDYATQFEIEMIEACGHFSPQVRPDIVNDAMRHFLNV